MLASTKTSAHDIPGQRKLMLYAPRNSSETFKLNTSSTKMLASTVRFINYLPDIQSTLEQRRSTSHIHCLQSPMVFFTSWSATHIPSLYNAQAALRRNCSVNALQGQLLHVQVLFRNLHTLLTINLVLWICHFVVIFARSLQTALLF